MWTQRLQKITSFFLIFFLLFSFTLRVPFLMYFTTPAFAGEKDFFNLVSILVDEDSYPQIKSKLIRYSQDIQSVLEDTRVVILPTPRDASVLDIASLNESLYFEGYKAHKNVDFESRLIGTVLVGQIPIPIVFDGGNTAQSILPYTDFEDKIYVFNHESGKYEKNENADTDINPEVWHGVISPNTGDDAADIEAIKDYFDKNHDFYTGQGVFDETLGVLSGDDSTASEDYEPYVFYYDQFRENGAIQYQNYVGYQMYLQNIEDITYNRYSKELAEKVKQQVLGMQNYDLVDLLTQIDPEFDISLIGAGPDTATSSDIMTRYITDNATKNFLEIFNSSALGDMRKYIYNAGRYNKGGSKVNVDMPPFLISVLDQVSAEVIKNVNNSLERQITDIVANGLSRKIAIPKSYNEDHGNTGGTGVISGTATSQVCGVTKYEGFYYGKQSGNITNASECSIYKGTTSASGTLVEANRGYDINLTQADLELCDGDFTPSIDTGEKISQGYWGGNSPLNFTLIGDSLEFQLGDHNLQKSIRPIFNILGSKETEDTDKVPSPLDCFEDGVLLKVSEDRLYPTLDDTVCGSYLQVPINGGTRKNWTCGTINTKQSIESFQTVYDSFAGGTFTVGDGGICRNEKLYLDGDVKKSKTTTCTGGGQEGCSCTPVNDDTYFKTISSYILHTSPTDADFGAQTQSMFTPSLPIDKDRYIDFIGAKGGDTPDYGYERIDFPQLFRVSPSTPSDLSLESIAEKTKEHLDAVSAQINTVILNADPSGLTGDAKTLYDDYFSTGEYPEANIDLYKALQDKPLEVFTIDNQSKEISYLDTLIFAVYWNNLKTISSKYKFVFENYLSNQFEGNDYNFHLPKSKKSYEMAYLGAPGDAQNMYIKLDPELKGIHPYAGILSANLSLNGVLMASSVATPLYPEGAFECGPPDGVNIFQWIPAIICWLKNMLPPKIKIGQGDCGDETLFLNDDEKAEILECEGDVNKNGVNDCIEGKLEGGSLQLISDAGRYYYFSLGTLQTQIRDSENELVRFDNNSYIDHSLLKVEIPTNPEVAFSPTNTTVVYDANTPSLATPEAWKEGQKYVGFTPSRLRAQAGETKTYFYAKGQDANLYFQSRLELRDTEGVSVIDLQSIARKVEIRGDQIFMNNYIVEGDGLAIADNTIHVSDAENICVVDGAKTTLEVAAVETSTISGAKEKLLFTIHNYSRAGNTLELSYPIDLELWHEGKLVFSQTNISEGELDNVVPLYIGKDSGRYEIHLKDANGFVTYRSFDLLPDVASKLHPIMSTSLVETNGNISTHLVTILDQYDNPATGEIYTLELSIDGDGLIFDGNERKEISYNIVEGYKAFRLRSTDIADINTIHFILKNTSGDTIYETEKTIRTIDDIQIRTTALDGAPKVGGEKYRYSVSFVDTAGNLLTDLNSRIYLTIGKLYGVTDTPYVDVVDGTAEIGFHTLELAARNIPIEFQLEGGNEIYTQNIDILPDLPIKIDLQLSRDRIEASPDDNTILEAILKDRYNNEVFTDNTTKLLLEIHEQSQSFLTASQLQKTVSSGKTQFQISGTDIPGIGYFKVSSDPSLAENSFELIGQAPFDKSRLLIPTLKNADGSLTERGKNFFKEYTSSKYISKFITKSRLTSSSVFQALPAVLQTQVEDFWDETNSLTVHGIGENAGSVETFFFWDKKDIEGSAYNTIYSVLYGADYGDVSQENYLAGALLFDRDNSALAVSSLLNSPYQFSDILSLEKNGALQAMSSGDITQDIQFEPSLDAEGRLILDIQNEALASYIGRIYYNISETSNIGVYANDRYRVESVGDDVIIKNNLGRELFKAYASGRFERKSGTSLQMDMNHVGEGIRLLIMNNGEEIGYLQISGKFNINITRDTGLLATKLTTLDDTLIIYLKSNQYSSHEVQLDADNSLVKLYYHDPFADNEALNDFHNTDGLGLESTLEEGGIGWQDPNTMLLSFAAGESVGEATKHFQSFSLVNLGDPVISLKPLTYKFSGTDIEKSFDPTVGELLQEQSDLIGFQMFDFNNDTRQDLLTIHTNGYIDLFENTTSEERFSKHSSLVYAADGGSVRLVKTGDFTGDGYGDIFFVTETGEPTLFNNREKDFIRIDLTDMMSLSGSIVQAEVFDMDADGKDDITTLDDAGEIHIFYGGGTAEIPTFIKNFIGDGYAIQLSNTTTSHGGAVYFDGLAQINPDDLSALLQETQDYVDAVEEASQDMLSDPDADIPAPELIDDSLVANFLYVGLPYVPTNYEPEVLDAESIIDGLDTIDSGSGETADALDDFLTDYDAYISYSGYKNAYNVQTYFLRSQYADLEGLEITKTYTDTTPPNLQTGDRVYLDITIKNTSGERINNIAYADKVPEYFSFINNEFEVISEENRVITRRPGVGEYNILIDGFYLEPGEETIIRLSLETLPLSYGHIQVGLYEDGEVGDDIWGDVIIKDSEKNCGKEANIYRSLTERSYIEGTTLPVCNAADIDIGTTFPELIDENDNGIPDYIEGLLEDDGDGNLVPITDSGSLLDYASGALNDLYTDTDGDGIPDVDDSMDHTDSATDFMGALDAINGAIDEISAELDTLIEGLSCGFGGGSCFANPLNWAPLAPGNDPTLFGMPIGDGLKVNEGIPIFSALTGRQVWGLHPICLPTVYPMSSMTFVPGPFCNPTPGAGGKLGVASPTNFVRLFATPTLTGGAGIAVCFGAPAIGVGNVPPMGVHPIVPGGNCIVVAMPLFGCEGGEGNPGILGYPYGGNFGIINANCDGTGDRLYTPQELESAFVQSYLEYLRTGIRPVGLYDLYVETFTQVMNNGGGNYMLPSEPLINIGGGGDESMSTSVDLDISALVQGNFQDVVQVKNKRIGAFPNFLMGWVERQLDEITSKLTNLPKIFVILPEFGGIFDYSWKDFGSGMQESFNRGSAENEQERANQSSQLASLRAQKSSLNCSGADSLRCRTIDLQIASVSGRSHIGNARETLSGIKEVYEFIGNIPLIDVETETINVNVPWIDGAELDRFMADWKYTLEQWKSEVEDAQNRWDITKDCNESTAAAQARCEQELDYKKLATIQANDFVGSLQQNIQILQEYKEFPEKLAKLINIKEVWLEQILCNIEAISTLMGGWINDNGERFKAWVELFMLIKAALKSWQLLIDVFIGYEEECHECKNERQDLQNFIFRLISSIIPSPPIIQFPKWPDIILDFHNIRAGMTIYMPDFEMNLRPIVLPSLPSLHLPDLPHANFSLPALPLLPRFTIPELPDLPSLPSIELPDLPPPPKIPKLFGAVEAVLNIMKLVTKVMCIIKKSPFVPEWRAGDQIAFLTERNGYLPMDFIDIQPPAFSYSMISAIKVTTYVNFEFEMEFIVEAVRAIVAPINDVTNNIVNMFDIQISDLDFTDAIPTDFDVELNIDGTIDAEDVSFAPLDTNPEGIYFIAGLLAQKTQELIEYLAEHSQEALSNKEFIGYVTEQLASNTVTSDPKTAELQALWKEVGHLTYSNEQKFIDELRINSEEKFQILKDIISTEIQYSKEQKETLKNLGTPSYTTQVSLENNGERIEKYNELLSSYNYKTLDAAIQLVQGENKETKTMREEVVQGGENFMRQVRASLAAYNEASPSPLLADHTPEHTAAMAETLSCSASQNDYVYEGIYVLEHGKNYRLFDYVDPLRGDETPTILDVDQDGDDDVFYLVKGRLYFKENRGSEPARSYVGSVPPLILSIADNTFYNGDVYHESVNGFAEASVSDGAINIEFQKPTDTSVKNFRLSYHTIVDKYRDESRDFIPETTQTHLVDTFADIEEDIIISSSTGYTLSHNLATLNYAGAMNNNLKLTTEKLRNIREDLADNTRITLTAGAILYAGINEFRLGYTVSGGEEKSLTIPAHQHVSFPHLIDIVGLSGNAYVSMGILQDIIGTDVIDYIGMPLSAGTKIKYNGSKDILSASSHIDIRYYDDTLLQMDMRDIDTYTLYDLGESAYRDEYKIRLEVPNDFYYARIQPFKEGVLGTQSQQILLAPQVYADTFPPQINLNQKIRIPVYQKQKVDLTPYIYEDGGLGGIAEVRVDFDLDIDLDGDGDPKNDSNTGAITIYKSPIKIEIEFGPYDTIFTKNISIALVDDVGNIGKKEVVFEVYPPGPRIDNIEENMISGIIDETLLDEPVRLYRYRGGIIEKLQRADGTDLIETSSTGSYDFETASTASGVLLTHSGFTLAEIDEYTGRIDLQHPLAQTRVLASNETGNTSVYPEIQVLFGGEAVFRQYVRIPEGEISLVNSFLSLDATGIYVDVLDEENYNSFRVPLGVPYNPGSVSVYRSGDSDKTAIMTIFRDGRINIDELKYRLLYRNSGDDASLLLVDLNTGLEVAKMVYHMQASYILN